MSPDTKQSPIPERWENVRRQTHEYNWAAKQEDLLRCIEELGAAEAERDALRATLISVGRNMGCFLANEVSTEFLSGLAEEAKLIQAKITALEADLDAAKLSIQQDFERIEELHEKVIALEASNKLFSEEYCKLEKHIEELQASSQMLQVKLDAATEDRDKWLAEHNRLQRERDALEAKNKELQDDWKELAAENDHLGAKVDRTKNERKGKHEQH